MQPHKKITAALNAANEAGRTGLVAFITAGYPEPEQFIATLQAVASASDVVEIGVPFSDPMADGMTIQRSSFKAIENGVTLRWIFSELERSGKAISAPLVMMSYLNPLLAFGYERLAERALATGVCAFIVPGSAIRGKRGIASCAGSARHRSHPAGHTGDARHRA